MMKKYFVGVFVLFLCSTAFATSLYKWTDEKGVVHYGDKDDSKGSAQQITTQPAPPPPAVAGATAATPATQQNTASVDPGALQTCLSMARSMADNSNMTPPEIRAESKKLLDLCPGTAYQCSTYLSHPADNTCKAVQMAPGGSIVSNSTYRR